MADVTVHITVPSQLFEDELGMEADDRVLGQFIREATAQGRRMIAQRVSDDVHVHHIEITLEDSVGSAEVEPE